MSDNTTPLIRLNKYISDTGFCSRREADKLIDEGRVTINGKRPEMGTKVAPGDQVKVDGKPVKEKEKPVYIAYNKPVGVTCTTERKIKSNIVAAVNYPKRIFPIGRLDRPSEGLIFMTNDGDIVNKILRAGNAHEKEYVVTVDKPINDRFIKRMGAGVPILGTVTQPCQVFQEGTFVFRIILTQGLNRQIRRMCEYLGYEVTKLKRTRIMDITLKDLPVGKWRLLTDKEMAVINRQVAGSSKTEDASLDGSNVSVKREEERAKPRGNHATAKKPTNRRKTAHRGAETSKRGDRPKNQPSRSKRHTDKPKRGKPQQRQRSAS